MADNKELTTNSDHPDHVLQRRIASGEVSKAEVEKVWRETDYLSAQTPYEVRKMVVEMKEAGHQITPAEQVIIQSVLDLRAALFRSDSKFAHLVSGTEFIVDKLQAVNRWELVVEQLNGRVSELTTMVSRLVEQREQDRQKNDRVKKALAILLADDEPSPPPQDDNPSWFAPADLGAIHDESEVATPAEPLVEEPYDRKIGSNWDPNNPRKK